MKISKDVEKLKSKHEGIKPLYESYKSRIKKKKSYQKKILLNIIKLTKLEMKLYLI